MAQKIKVGVLGAGRWGPNLLRNFDSHARSQVVALADTDAQRLKVFKDKYPKVQAVDNAQAIFNNPEVDAVVICTPTDTHYELTREALSKGKHVFVEKPLATTVAHCDELVELARKKERLLFVGHIFVYNAGIQYVKNLITKGELGRIYYIHMTRTNLGPIRTDVSAFWDLAPHDLSILNYWLGMEPIEVSAVGGRFLNDGIDDVVLATYSYSNGMRAHIHVSWLNPSKVREITIVGEKKMLIWDDMNLNQPVRIYDKNVDVAPDAHSSVVDTFVSFRASVHEGDTLIPKISLNEPLSAECNAFLAAIDNPSQCISTGEHGRSVVRLLAATEASIHSRGKAERIT